MACEFLGTEYTSKGKGHNRSTHERQFCTINGEGCLIDDAIGYVNCTRRTFVLLQGGTPITPGHDRPNRKPQGPPDCQMPLLLSYTGQKRP